jgi:hypothetical protein
MLLTAAHLEEGRRSLSELQETVVGCHTPCQGEAALEEALQGDLQSAVGP